MSDIQLFRLQADSVTELSSQSVTLEKNLQKLVESHMETFLGVRFLATEYATGKTHRGRIDSLGLDENSCPVIVEYKRHSNENVINQGLFYLDWLLDHKAEFRWLVMERLGKDVADVVEWEGTRLICIAADFTKYDQHAVQQIPRNIELIRYKYFGADLLLLELVNTQASTNLMPSPTKALSPGAGTVSEDLPKAVSKDKSFEDQLSIAQEEIRAVYSELSSFVYTLGDDVTEKQLRLYVAFKKLKNFATVVAYPNRLLVYLKLVPSSVAFEDGFSRDVSEIGHWGTGDVELVLRNAADFEKAKPLLERAYQEG
ncbi:DUF5655 domain-containing protein [Alcaligenes faecalis]|uniref:DUF5655 domain-containing protein n=1 Tax=Alcaligenes faecalis TaxID=511 RepID=UPI001C833EA3|nr:DUF5655 domain-containing protein [Alcaligenes faecalis]MBX6963418.1 DUF91 domain-containing protein [Providencia rettgeri]MBX7030068.1 DUF91 domain-containing protein [Alcaligenes faecalis]